ncbi:unnamed protein product, partial [Allacma fusca]
EDDKNHLLEPSSSSSDVRISTPAEPSVLSIEFILKEIFNCLSVRDLLRCSLVNRAWNLHSRSILRDKKKCVAEVVGHRPCYT